jgi:catalase
MDLNKTADNEFNRTNRAYFLLAWCVGITLSSDNSLESLLMSVDNTHEYRLAANYLQLPTNAPTGKFLNVCTSMVQCISCIGRVI